MGEPRRLDPPLVPGAGALQRRRRRFREQPAELAPRPGDRRARRGLRRVSSLCGNRLQSLRPHLAAADAGPGHERAAAGPRARHSSADPLSRLCRLRGALRLRRRRPARRKGGRGLGPLGAALGAHFVVLPHLRHRARLLVGVLRSRLGRLLVLGPGRELFASSLAHRHGAFALGDRRREAGRAQNLDAYCWRSPPLG